MTQRRRSGNDSLPMLVCLVLLVLFGGMGTATTLAFQQPQQRGRVKGKAFITSCPPLYYCHSFLLCPTKRKRKLLATKKESSSASSEGSDSSSSSLLPPKRSSSTPRSKGPPRQNNRGTYNRRRVNSSKTGTSTRSSAFDRQRTLNRGLTNCQNGKELLQVLSQQQTMADGGQKKTNALAQRCGGGALNSVNFSTSLHRLARHSVNYQKQQKQAGGDDARAGILKDPRFALLMSCLAEALVENLDINKHDDSSSATNNQVKKKMKKIEFQSREFSNIGWALAKLKLAPPSTAMPLTIITIDEAEEEGTTGEEDIAAQSLLSDLLESKARLVREQVLEVAAERRKQQQQEEPQEQEQQEALATPRWIPALSQLAGHILDVISYQVLTYESSSSSNNKRQRQRRRPFQMQEYANILWALATSGRAHPIVFDAIITSMMDRQRQQLQLVKTSCSGGGGGDDDLTPESLLLSDTTSPTSKTNRGRPHPSQQQRRQQQGQDDAAVLRPQEWSNSIWAFATAQIYSENLLSFVAELLETQDSFIHDFKTQELSNTVWGVATLLSNKMNNHREGEEEDDDDSAPSNTSKDEAAALSILRVFAKQALIDRAGEFRSQELSNTLWAMATLGFGLEPSADMALNNYIVLNSDQLDQDRVLMQASVDAIVQAALKILPRFRSQELNNMAWALARLIDQNDAINNHRIHDVLQGIGLQLCDRRRKVKLQDIGTTLWSLSTRGFVNEDIYRGLVSRLNPRMVQRGKPQELSNTLWALASADLEVEDQDAFDTSLLPKSERTSVTDPITMVFGLAGVELMRRPFEFKPQEMKDVLWSFSKIGIRHPRLFKCMAEHLIGSEEGSSADVRGFSSFSRQGLGNMAWAFARQAQLAAEIPDRRKASSPLAQSNGRLAVYTASYLDIGEVLIQRLFNAIAETALHTHDKLSKLKPQDLSNTAWTYSVLGLSHTGFMETAKSELRRRVNNFLAGDTRVMNCFKGQELANLLWALATLNIPAGNILESLVPYFERICEDEQGQVTPASIAKIFKRQELANLAWACAVFGSYPNGMMRLLYNGLVGLGDDQLAPSILADAHGDTGLQSQAIMCLIYVQAEMDLEGKSEGLMLPPDFPNGWKQLTANAKDDHMTETTIELSLSTSKIQRAVSSCFTRIGFDHVEEHVITMEEMSNDHGISFSPKPLEILSIDIANLEEKIAIEVDGPAHFVSQIDEVTDDGGHTRLVNGKLEYQFRWKGDKQQINGPTALKQRLLSLLGWRVIHIPFWEWYALCADEAAQDDYCRRLLLER